MNMKRILAYALVASTSLLLSACFVPEKFSATVEFKDDLSYTYQFKGTTAFVPALIDLKRKVPPKPDAAKMVAAEGVKYKANHPDVKSLDYRGDARFDTLIEGSKPAGAVTEILDILVIGQDKQGNSGVGTKMQQKDVAAFKDLGMTIEGKLVVKLPSGANIVKTNGTVSKGFWPLGGTSVEWEIQKAEERPIVLLKMGT